MGVGRDGDGGDTNSFDFRLLLNILNSNIPGTLLFFLVLSFMILISQLNMLTGAELSDVIDYPPSSIDNQPSTILLYTQYTGYGTLRI